jgi:hypothetical protein
LGNQKISRIMCKLNSYVGVCRYSRTPTLHCNKCLSLTVKMSLKRASLLAPKRAVCVAGVLLTAARRSWAGGAGESPYGSGKTGEAGAGTDVLEEWLVQWPLKGAFLVAEFSTRSVSAGSQLTAARRGVGWQSPV